MLDFFERENEMLKEATSSIYFDYYRENIFYLEAVAEKLLERIGEIDRRREESGRRKICENIFYRIKSPESMKRKLIKRGFEDSVTSAMEHIFDAAGIRIICSYKDDCYTIAKEIASCSDIEVLQIKDYIKKPKENGYRSYHMIVRTPVKVNGETHFVNAEIQVRTMVMNSWAVAEHQLKYKNDEAKNEGHIEMLRNCAEEMMKIDDSMMRIRDMMHLEETPCKRAENSL